jgi:uncharacterized protein YoxC
MNAGQLAALIAAGFFALGVCVAVFVLFKLAKLTTEATRYLSGMRESTDTLIEQAHAAIDRTHAELDRTEVITANMDQVTANVAELTGHVNALANVARSVAAGPVGKAGALAYGVRRAVALRRHDDGDAVAQRPPIAARRPEIEPGPGPDSAGAATQVRRTVVAWTIGRVIR